LAPKGTVAILNILITLVCLAVLPPRALAEQPPTTRQKMVKAADKAGDRVARAIDSTATRIDLYLAGRKYTRKKNTSSISIKQLMVATEGGNQTHSTSFGINLRLPNLEKRFQVRFSSYDEEAESRDLRQRRFRTRARENDPGAALLFFRKLGKVKTTFQPRLELKDPLEMSYLLRFESDAGQGPVRVNPKLDLFADPEKGTGQYFQLNFSYDLSPRWEVSLLNEEEYRQRGNFLNVNHGIAFDYSIDDNKGSGLSFSTNSINRGGGYHLESYTVSPAFGHELSADRLRYVVATFLTFAKPEAFKGNAGMSAQLEVIF